MELKITDEDLRDADSAHSLIDFLKARAGIRCEGCTTTGRTAVAHPEFGAPYGPTVAGLVSAGHLPETAHGSAELDEGAALGGEAGLTAPFAHSTVAVEAPQTAPVAPPAISPAPPAPPAPAPTPAGGAVALMAGAVPVSPAPVDSGGMPWDARIHAKNKATVADGSWRKAKGVDAALITQVEAELRASGRALPSPATTPGHTAQEYAPQSAMTLPPPPLGAPLPSAPVAPPPPAAPVESFEDQLRRAQTAPLPLPAGWTPPPPPPPPAPVETIPTFNDIVMVITTNALTEGEFLPVFAKHGASDISGLAGLPQLFPAVLRDLRALRGQ